MMTFLLLLFVSSWVIWLKLFYDRTQIIERMNRTNLDLIRQNTELRQEIIQVKLQRS